MLLRHEHGVKVPEGGLDESICGHLGEASEISGAFRFQDQNAPHVEEDLTEFLTDFEKGMQGSTIGCEASSLKVVLLELGILPSTPVLSVYPYCRVGWLHSRSQHLNRQVGLQLLDLGRELCSLGNRVVGELPVERQQCKAVM